MQWTDAANAAAPPAARRRCPAMRPLLPGPLKRRRSAQASGGTLLPGARRSRWGSQLELQLRRKRRNTGADEPPSGPGRLWRNAAGANAPRVRGATGSLAPSPDTPAYRSGFGRSASSPREGSSRAAFAHCPTAQSSGERESSLSRFKGDAHGHKPSTRLAGSAGW